MPVRARETGAEAGEARRILALVAGDAARAVGLVESQLNVLQARGQVLLSLAGVVVTVTGFSGRAIAATGPGARGLLVAGLLLVLASAVWVCTRVASIKWVTTDLGDDLEESLAVMLSRRNGKTRAYRAGGWILSAGLASYCLAIAWHLLA